MNYNKNFLKHNSLPISGEILIWKDPGKYTGETYSAEKEENKSSLIHIRIAILGSSGDYQNPHAKINISQLYCIGISWLMVESTFLDFQHFQQFGD